MPNSNPGTLELLALELSNAIAPIGRRLHHDRLLATFSEFGLVLPHSSITPALENALEEAHHLADHLPNFATELSTAIENENIGEILSKGLELMNMVKTLIESFDNIADFVNTLGVTGGLTAAEFSTFVNELPGRLTETVIVEYLEESHPIVFSFFELFGLLSQTRLNPGSVDPLRHENVHKKLHLDRIGSFLSNPEQALKDLYHWGDNNFDGRLFIERLYTFFRAFNLPVARKLTPGVNPRSSLEIFLFSLTTTEGINPPGLAATIMLDLAEGFSLSFPVFSGWELELNATGGAAASAGIMIQPPATISFIPPSGTLQGRFSIRLARVPDPGASNFTVIGLTGSSGIFAQRISIGLVTILTWDSGSGQARGDFGFEGSIENGEIRISANGADGFIGNLLSGFEINSNFSIAFGWTAGHGFYFTGSSSLEIQLPVHVNLGPVELEALTLGIGIEGNNFPISFSTDIKANLGPLKAVVQQIGATAFLQVNTEHKGSAGPFDLSFGFKPPNGVGLSVDAGVIKGGGYLFFDFDKGEYAGALELTFSGIVSLKAIGIITTKMPDGSDGFSLLIIITAEFGAGIQLGFGFVLLGVGGLLGLNRTMKLQPLAEGVRTGGINGIMFPTDIVANAPRIISDLRNYFPPEEGKFLIGPMAKLGWGTPALISVSLGIIIEIPGNIAILGILKIALPTEDAALIVLQINFIGAIEFDKSRLWFFASLYESRILFITLEGEMGLLVAWGNDANFVVSVGGFHPSFNPPPLPFGSIARLSLNILNESWGRIRVMTYFAVTSNTVQFGAHAELYFGFSAINIDGHIGFDALFQFSPFYFIIELSASLSVKVFGIGLFSVGVRMSLEGPTPYRARGTGSISLFFFDIDVDFDETWGESQNTTLPPIQVMPLLKAEFGKLENWKAQLPAGTNILVSLRAIDTAAELVLHPVGTLQVSQRYVPLDITLDKVGTQKPSDVKKFTLSPEASSGLNKKGDVKESFAMAQFQEMSSTTKLSRPSFEKEDGGLELSISGQQVTTGKAVKRIVRYELIVIDTNFKRFARRFFDFISGILFLHFLKGNAVANSPLSYKTKKQYQPYEEKIEVKQGTYSVANVMDNKAFNAGSASFSSEAQAREFMRQQVMADSNLKDNLHVISQYEVNIAA